MLRTSLDAVGCVCVKFQETILGSTVERKRKRERERDRERENATNPPFFTLLTDTITAPKLHHGSRWILPLAKELYFLSLRVNLEQTLVVFYTI